MYEVRIWEFGVLEFFFFFWKSRKSVYTFVRLIILIWINVIGVRNVRLCVIDQRIFIN